MRFTTDYCPGTHDIRPTAEQVRFALGAMQAVADVSGPHPLQVQLIEAGKELLGYEGPVDAASDPGRGLALVPELVPRIWIVQAMIVTALTDGEIREEEVEVIERFAQALEVDEPRVEVLRLFVNGEYRQARIKTARAGAINHFLRQAYEEQGVRGLWSMIGTRFGRAQSPALAWQFRQLGLLPRGTLGRTFWASMTKLAISFPGEAYGLPERVVWHDLAHTLTGYSTTSLGEILLAAYEAGSVRFDSFKNLFVFLMQTHVGFNIVPTIFPAAGNLDPRAMLYAIARGRQARYDVSVRWGSTGAGSAGFWEDMAKPLSELREEFGIGEPLTPDPALSTDTGIVDWVAFDDGQRPPEKQNTVEVAPWSRLRQYLSNRKPDFSAVLGGATIDAGAIVGSTESANAGVAK